MKSRHESPRPTDTVQCALSPGFARLNPVNPGRTYATRKFYFDTITFDTQMLRHMIDKYGPGHVLLGTDYPYDMGEENPVKLIESVPRLARADRERIMGGNAARLLKIKR
jgi:predicted TIM-barrel fold metal-dependent hydrolase